MKIAILGYGKMGKTIESLIENKYKKHEIVLKTFSQNANTLSISDLQKADVAIEFSTPTSTLPNINLCLEAKIPVVVGTTGWYSHFNAVKKKVSDTDGALFYATNFSVGVNIFFELNTKLAEMMQSHSAYTPKIEEIHHTTKKDAPSGTAITLAEDIIWANPDLNKWINEQAYNNDELTIISHRKADVKGTHQISYTSKIDNIEITHTAHSREGFADGAIKAAEWLVGKKGVFTMKDMLRF